MQNEQTALDIAIEKEHAEARRLLEAAQPDEQQKDQMPDSFAPTSAAQMPASFDQMPASFAPSSAQMPSSFAPTSLSADDFDEDELVFPDKR